MKPYSELRGRMAANEISQIQLARKMNCGLSYVSERMTGKKPWSLDEMYYLMDLFDLPHERLHEVFPPACRNAKRAG